MIFTGPVTPKSYYTSVSFAAGMVKKRSSVKKGRPLKKKYNYHSVERDELVRTKQGSRIYRREKGEFFVVFRRARKNDKYFIRTYHVTNPEDGIRKRGFKPRLKLIDSRRGNGFSQVKKELASGKIFKEYRREKLNVDVHGTATYSYFSRKPPRSTPYKTRDRKERYLIQFFGYFQAHETRPPYKTIIVSGFSDGYEPGVRRPPRNKLIDEAMDRASGEAGSIFGHSDFSLSLYEGGYRYHAHR